MNKKSTKDIKTNFYIDFLKDKYENKTFLKASEVLQLLGISRSKFQDIIKKSKYHELPKFSTTTYKRGDEDYTVYKFSLYDIALFLAGDKNE